MKIMKILRTNIFNIQNFKGNDNDAESFLFHNNETFVSKPDAVNPDSYTIRRSPASPLYYKAAYNIDSSISVDIKLKQEDTTLAISPKTVAKHLHGNNRGTQKALINEFVKIYTSALQKRYDLEDSIFTTCLQTLKDNSESRKQENANESELNKKSLIATCVLSERNKRLEEAKKEAYNEAEIFFDFSKTSWGYDFSKENDKRELAEVVNKIQHKKYASPDFLPELLLAIKDEDGNIDISLARLICKFVSVQDFANPPGYIADTIKHFVNKDPENKDEIIGAMLELNNTDFQIDNCDPAFENLMKACFVNDKGFVKEVFEIILKLAQVSDEYLDFLINTDNIDENNILYYLHFASNLILGYLESAMDEEGNLNETEIPNAEDFQETIEELFEN